MQRYFAKYYHSYLDSLVDFLIPRGKRVLRLGIKIEMEKSVKYDYVVLRDVLVYVYDVQNYFKEIKDLLT